MKKVYIPFIGNHDSTPLAVYGQLVFITDRPTNPTGISGIEELINRCFYAFPPSAEDYLVACGHQVIVALASLEFAKRFECINYLVFDAKKQSYVERIVRTPLTKATLEWRPTEQG